MAAVPLAYTGRALAAADYAAPRRRMLDAIARLTSLTVESTGVEAIDAAVMGAIDRVPRHEFVPAQARSSAYANRPLSIGHGQTISQPYIVALMTHLLEVEPGGRVLEIGTGSGYQAAVLAELATEVAASFGTWRDCGKRLGELRGNEQEKLRLLDLYTFQHREI